MRSLPFVVKPKAQAYIAEVGNDKIGIIRIERRGYLNVTEKAFVDQVSQSPETVASTVALATKISAKTKKTVEECYTGIMEAVQGATDNKFAMRIKEEYPDEIGTIMSQLIDTASKRNLACANILIQSRVDPEWEIEDTLAQHPEMIEALAEFYNQEDQGFMGEEEPQDTATKEEQVTELVGK